MAEVLTFGCRLNTVESEAIHALAAHQPGTVVNTCAVTLAAERDARHAIARLHRARPGAPIVVTGCAAQIDPARWAALPGVTRVLGNQEKLRPDAWHAAASMVAPIAQARGHAPATLPGLRGRARAYLDVQQGCDHACTFCIIPQGRGPARSVPPEAVAHHLRHLVDAGQNEVVLTGVDLASWGRDLPGGPSLASLLRHVLAAVPGLRRLRLSSLDPAALDPAFLAVLSGEERLMPHLHLSLQAGSDMVLTRMRRRHRRADVLDLVARARAARPGLAIAADLIAGFPTETDAQFADTLDLVAQASLPYVHVFPYSARPGTPAARMPQVPPTERRRRAALLRDAALPHAAAFHAALVGQERDIVAERGGARGADRGARGADRGARGHTPEFAPVRGLDAEPGQLVRRRILRADAEGVEV